MGSAACYHLARRGLRTLGLERFDIPHTMGSSHGITRIIRLAYYEHPSYVPLLLRAFDLWDELERECGRDLLEVTGTIDASAPDDIVFTGALASCEQFGLAHEVLTSAELTARYPGYQLPPGHLALFQPRGGFLLPERCISAHVEGALAAGAEIRARERVIDWEPVGNGVRVSTDRGVEEVDPDDFQREASMADEAPLRDATARYFPAANGPTMALRTCMFTNTPDEHFILDVLPEHPQVVVASPCSGHGFKFASVIGEILANLAQSGETWHDIELLRLSRFAEKPIAAR
ncbi:MAG: dependent oxidoreductase [Thermomicrobiales bacterium]|nr:dependent oxidoreductase [Thermomicrobiales bacterium]